MTLDFLASFTAAAAATFVLVTLKTAIHGREVVFYILAPSGFCFLVLWIAFFSLMRREKDGT